jgi:hypothetical protein
MPGDTRDFDISYTDKDNQKERGSMNRLQEGSELHIALSRVQHRVKASHEESFILWKAWHKTHLWKQDLSGFGYPIGEVEGRPVFMSFFFADIDNQRVLFWELTSQVVDAGMAEAWLDQYCKPPLVDQLIPHPAPMEMVEDVHALQQALSEVVYLAEASPYEMQALHSHWSLTETWDTDPQGFVAQIGELGPHAVRLNVVLATINGRRVAFWDPASQVFDYVMAEAWLKEQCTSPEVGADVPDTNATNFAHCIHAIHDMNEPLAA